MGSLFYYVKKNQTPNDKLKGVRCNVMTKEIGKYKDGLKTVVDGKEKCNYITVCAALTFIFKHVDDQTCCQDLATDVEHSVITPVNKPTSLFQHCIK